MDLQTSLTIDLPLPPPPSPTELQQFEHSLHFKDVSDEIGGHHLHHQHLRAPSSLSSISTASQQTNSSQSSFSPTHSNFHLPIAFQRHPRGDQQRPEAASSSSSFSLESESHLNFGNHSPLHSRQASSSSSSISFCSGDGSLFNSNTMVLTAASTPPPPVVLKISPLNNMQKNVSELGCGQQKENDANITNRVEPTKAGGGPLQPLALQPKCYNKFLKEYSNKLLTQNLNTIHHQLNSNADSLNNKNDFPANNNCMATYNQQQACAMNGRKQECCIVSASQTTNINVSYGNVDSLSVSLLGDGCSVLTTTFNNQLKYDEMLPIPDTKAKNYSTQSLNHLNQYNLNSGDRLRSSDKEMQEPSTLDLQKPFEYVTLAGNVIRSVLAPGKGAPVHYKVR